VEEEYAMEVDLEVAGEEEDTVCFEFSASSRNDALISLEKS